MGQVFSSTNTSGVPNASDVIKTIKGLACLVENDYVSPCQCQPANFYDPGCQASDCFQCGRGLIWTEAERESLESFIDDVNYSLNNNDPNLPWYGNLQGYLNAGICVSCFSKSLSETQNYTLSVAPNSNGGHPGFDNINIKLHEMTMEIQQQIAVVGILLTGTSMLFSDKITNMASINTTDAMLYYFQHNDHATGMIGIDYLSMNVFITALSKIYVTNDSISIINCHNIVVVSKPCLLLCGQMVEYGTSEATIVHASATQKIYCGTFMTTEVSMIVVPNGMAIQDLYHCPDPTCSNACGPRIQKPLAARRNNKPTIQLRQNFNQGRIGNFTGFTTFPQTSNQCPSVKSKPCQPRQI